MKKKLRIVCNWDNDTNILNRFLNNFLNDDNQFYEYTLGDDYDYIIVFNYTNQNIDYSKAIVFIQEPSWSSHIKIDFLRKCKLVFFHDKSLLKLNNIIESPIMMFSHSRENIKKLSNLKYEKTKNISFITSSLTGNEYYDYRVNLVNNILKTNLDIDIFGYGWQLDDKRYKGPLNDKKDGLIEYKFSIAIENSSEKNYCTEKFFDCILFDTVPIYKGSPNINEIYPKESYINLDDNIIDYLINIDYDTIYKCKTKYITDAKNKYLNDYNIINFLNKIL